MNLKTSLAILNKVNQRRAKATGLAKGFTLVELMIVVAVIGILSAVALPQYLQARNSAEAGAAIGEALGLAKECATFAASDVGAPPAAPPANGRVEATTPCTASGGVYTVTWTAGPVGISCLTANSKNTDNTATINVNGTGTMTCKMPSTP